MIFTLFVYFYYTFIISEEIMQICAHIRDFENNDIDDRWLMYPSSIGYINFTFLRIAVKYKKI